MIESLTWVGWGAVGGVVGSGLVIGSYGGGGGGGRGGREDVDPVPESVRVASLEGGAE